MDSIAARIDTYITHQKTLTPADRRAAWEDIFHHINIYLTLAEEEIRRDQFRFGHTLYTPLITAGLAEQIDGTIRLTHTGKELLILIATYLDPATPPTAG